MPTVIIPSKGMSHCIAFLGSYHQIIINIKNTSLKVG